MNGTTGITSLFLNVNGHVFHVSNLTNKETLTLSIASALHAGTSNHITVVGVGPTGSSADFFLGPPA
jgi:hypothetical protein